eukprot:COSAG01_NODE_10413_length_2172_cov_6.070912_1_plen_330_part_00
MKCLSTRVQGRAQRTALSRSLKRPPPVSSLLQLLLAQDWAQALAIVSAMAGKTRASSQVHTPAGHTQRTRAVAATALRSWSPSEDEHSGALSLEKGDRVRVLSVAGEWAWVSRRGPGKAACQGYVPRSYVWAARAKKRSKAAIPKAASYKAAYIAVPETGPPNARVKAIANACDLGARAEDGRHALEIAQDLGAPAALMAKLCHLMPWAVWSLQGAIRCGRWDLAEALAQQDGIGSTGARGTSGGTMQWDTGSRDDDTSGMSADDTFLQADTSGKSGYSVFVCKQPMPGTGKYTVDVTIDEKPSSMAIGVVKSFEAIQSHNKSSTVCAA